MTSTLSMRHVSGRKQDMATILKWWKMKMLGGYKHMPGLISESECEPSMPSMPAEGSQKSSFCCRGHRCPSSTDETQLCDETDHECDQDACSVASEENGLLDQMTRPTTPATPTTPASPEKKPPKDEFNFTLYDFDGHGKVTKDDIAGLVRAIYDVVGSSVRVPPSGSKTIHVKLTVTPEEAAKQRDAQDVHQRGLDITIRGPESDVIPGDNDVKLEPARRPRSQSVRVPPTPSQGRPPAADLTRRNLMEALHLGLQANNFKLTNLKRHHSDRDQDLRRRLQPRQPVDRDQDLRRRLQPRQPADPKCCPSGRAPCPKDNTPDANAGCGQCVKDRWSRRHAACKARPCQPANAQQERCYQEDDYELLARCAEFALREAHEKQEVSGRNRQKTAAAHAGGSPHHHMKHKNRERDHYRAMQQVLSWLEREHPAPSPAPAPAAAPGAAGCGCGRTCGTHQMPAATPPPQPALQPQQPLTQRVEHHHMHEHVHHHYHHFAKGAVIL